MSSRSLRRGLAVLLLAAGGFAACHRDTRTPLVLYSPHGRDLLGLVETEYERAHPEIDVRWLDMGSQEVYDRLRSEKANPQADVWYGGPNTIFARGVSDGLLAANRPEWADAVAPESRHPGDFYFGLYRTPAMPVYNEKAIPADQAPREWDDLLDPKWKGKILIRDPLASGTMRAVWGWILSRSVKETGSPDRGFAWLARLDAQTKEYVFNPILMYEKIVRQEGLLTIWDLPDTLLERQRGSPLQYVFPPSGTPVIDDAVGLVAGAKHAAAAKAFIDFLGSKDMQRLAAEKTFRLPARTDIGDALPAWARDVEKRMVVADVDWGLVERDGSEWMARWDRTVRGKGAAAH
ncbi:MAG TPA: extracellular solute-binding protein [Thermoanaerobaculia bacterium]|jgi:iron(III) transport system substrate-binding protein|nr:extracellular solute-binding protein [Thermoanaerobaculia bacterium]